MPIALPDEDFESPSERRSLFTRLLNAVRVYNVPLINFLITLILGFFLMKLTTKYTGLYMKNSLITIIITNLVLYGISETLAQTLLSFKRSQPQIAFRLSSTGVSFNSRDISSHEDFTPYDDTDDEGIDRFVNYVQRDNESFTQPYEVEPPIVPLSYFDFSRLAGFMCWGFIMGFAQCLWYKFLQIYSKDPKFIEVLRKVLTDQLCYSPVSLFCFFTYGTMVLESGSWEDTKAKLGRVYLKTLIVNYSVWFPVQFFNFLIIPRNYQVPFSSSISVLWNCFLSMKNSSS